MDESAWDDDLSAYYAEHDEMRTDADARGPAYLRIERGKDKWHVRQVVDDPAGDHDWGIDAEVDLAASDAAGQAVIVVLGLNRL